MTRTTTLFLLAWTTAAIGCGGSSSNDDSPATAAISTEQVFTVTPGAMLGPRVGHTATHLRDRRDAEVLGLDAARRIDDLEVRRTQVPHGLVVAGQGADVQLGDPFFAVGRRPYVVEVDAFDLAKLEGFVGCPYRRDG